MEVGRGILLLRMIVVEVATVDGWRSCAWDIQAVRMSVDVSLCELEATYWRVNIASRHWMWSYRPRWHSLCPEPAHA